MNLQEIFQDINKNLSIGKGNDEDINDWCSKVVYSALGKIALASLWDNNAVDNVSIKSFKSKIKTGLAGFVSLLQTTANYLQDEQALADEIYQIYLSTGFMYHSAFNISPPASISTQIENVVLLRGSTPLQLNFISGLGEYKLAQSLEQDNRSSVSDMFSLHQPFCNLVSQYEKSAVWTNANLPENAEFLELSNFRRGYWQKIPDKIFSFSLSRVSLQVGYNYYAYRYRENTWQRAQLPEWMSSITMCGIEKPEWLALATGILMYNHKMPNIHTIGNGELLTVFCPYLLPPAEEAFFKLYSWPMSHDNLTTFGSRINRQMNADVYPMFKATMLSLGYQFKEEL